MLKDDGQAVTGADKAVLAQDNIAISITISSRSEASAKHERILRCSH